MGLRCSFFAIAVIAAIAIPVFSSLRSGLNLSYGKLPLSFVESGGQVDE